MRTRVAATKPDEDLESAAIWVDPRKLKPWAGNPRINDAAVDHVARSIREFGFATPIVARRANWEIIAGHTRWKAALQLGLSRVPVRFLELGEEQAHQLAIADNKLGELADWDLPQVHRVMQSWDVDAVKRLGFSDKDMRAIEKVARDAVKPPSSDTTPPPPSTPLTKPGDLWRLGKNRLLCGDACNPDDVRKALGALKPRLMVTAPPYGNDYDPDWRVKLSAPNESKSKKKVVQDWTPAFRLFAGDVAYIWHAGNHAGMVEENLRSCSLLVRQQIIWMKQAFVIGRAAYQWQHEPCWYAVRKGLEARWCGDRDQSTVWQIANSNPLGGSQGDLKTHHPQQKPVECFSRPAANHGVAGDVIYDPFAGSGTAFVAAEKTDRVCVALEIDPANCDVIVNRWQVLTGGRAKLAAV